jgi:hypothetical protein
MTVKKYRWLKRLGIISGGFLSIVFIGFLFLNEKKPKGETGAKAEALAQKIQKAIHYDAWDSTEVVTWTFANRNSFLWDKKRHWVKVNWKNYEALIRIDSVDGKVWKNGQIITSDKKRQKLIKKGIYFWQNDSFWLNAPSKLYDKGTERRYVNYKGRDALLITYKLGGTTPGDSYLWLVDKNGLPTHWKLWVKIIPIGGVKFTWEDWKTTETGAKIATLHKGIMNLKITDVKTGNLSDFGDNDPFEAILDLK